MGPLAIDLFCGLGGWTEGLLAEGYRVIGFDNERHAYGEARYPAQLVLQDVLTLHGAQFKDAALIVASPPCQEFSYMAMPWSKAKAKQRAIEADMTGLDRQRLTRLFDACFRIQREACEAAGRHIPLVVENVCGAQTWVGRARWHYGSFYLWGDVPALMPITKCAKVGGFSWSDYGQPDYKARAFNGTADSRLREAKTGMCIHGTHWSAECRECGIWRIYPEGVKVSSEAGRRTDVGNGVRLTSRDCGIERVSFGSGVPGGDTRDYCGNAGSDQQHARSMSDEIKGVGIGSVSWGQGKGNRHPNDPRNFYSKSNARKAASAHIAKIPFPLAQHIAHAWLPSSL